MAITRHSQSHKMQRCEAYVRALEQERTKIQFFQRELPLCLELVTRAIESCKQQLSETAMECDSQNEQSEGSEPKVLEEFVPIPDIVKRASSISEECDSKKPRIDVRNDDENVKKSDWLRSVQLWNQTPDPPSKEDGSAKKVGVKRHGSGGAFQPFKKEKSADIVPPTVNTKEENEGPSRKSRRCWSPQLHKKFLQALHELGGSHVATPKQIRDLMNVEGLTNDEVKSHLQKYRLHNRRPVPSSQNTTTATTQAPQFVVVTGGLWMPPEYNVAVAAATTSREAPNGIFAPIASLPPPFRETSATSTQQQRSNNETSDSNVGGSRSPVTSSSVHAATASLAC